jgi:lipooligosaccharide transport system ATP-binding protein
MSLDDVVLSVTGLRKSYGDAEVLRGLDFAIRRGECFGLLGPNGAGKTTTLRCCLGLTDPNAGTITLVGEPVPEAARKARIRVGVVPQMDNLDPDFTVVENLLIYGRYFRLPDALISERIPYLLEFSGLAAKAHASIRTLSGGMKRRLILARALVNDPELLILDEPTTGLDPQARRQLWELIEEFKRTRRRTILLTTHYMEEAERLCDRVAIMDHGKVIALGTPRELIASIGVEHLVEFSAGEALDASALARIEGIRDVRTENGNILMQVTALHRAVPALLDELGRQGVPLTELRTHSASLEDVFVALTGRHLRDD